MTRQEHKLHGQIHCKKIYAFGTCSIILNCLFHDSQGMDIELLDTIESPVINGYRTKCEFTIGKDLNGSRTVGFLLGLYRDGITAVISPDDCLHVPDKAKEVAKVMEVITYICGCMYFTSWFNLQIKIGICSRI
jgi:hypothetical protein